MSNIFKKAKAGFIFKSLLWSVLLYACTISIVHWNDITKKETTNTVVYSSSDNSRYTVKVSIDSLRKQISTADYVLRYLYVTLK